MNNAKIKIKTNNKFLQVISDKINLLENTPDNKEKEEQKNITLNVETNNKNNDTEDKNNNIIIESLQTPSSNDLFPIDTISCKIHKKDFLLLDKNNFEIICQKCVEEENKSQLEINTNKSNYSTNISKENAHENLSNNNEEIFCSEHYDKKGIFYCDDCKEFICEICFDEEHRLHNCHLPNLIKKELKKYLDESINFMSELEPIFIQNINEIKKIFESLLALKNSAEKLNENTCKILINNNESRINIINQNYINGMIGVDKNISNDYDNYNFIKEKYNRYKELLEKMIDNINNKEINTNNFLICGYHKNQFILLNEIENYIKSSLNFINIRLKNTNDKYEKNKNKIENSINISTKELSKYEKSCISSISTRHHNKSIILHRFIHFSHKEIKYFKSTIIAFASDNNIFLTGLSICGLYNKKIKKNKLDNLDVQGKTEVSQENKIDILINIYKMVFQKEGEKLFSEKFELKQIKGIEDPCMIINFEKGVVIEKEKLYLIKIENLSENNYIDIITGDAPESKKKNIQVIQCHNSGFKFIFKQTDGLTTDFEELNHGIIEGILYSYNK